VKFRDDIGATVRSIVRVRRAPRLALVLVLASTALPVLEAVEALSGHVGSIALADEERSLEVGTELMATSDVTLHQAEIAKGSKVSVTKLSKNGGQLDAVSVALADGHVVKVTIAQVHTYFRVVDE
jgi:hypothetical protein